MARFEFATATRIVFGVGVLPEVGSAVKSLGQRALIVTGSNTTRAARLIEILSASGIAATCFPAAGEPSVSLVQDGIARAREGSCDVILGYGGGSAIDAAKAISALLTNGGDLYDYLEVIGRGKPLLRPAAPFIAIPTTAGTGAEVTRNAVLSVPDQRVKVSLRSPLMLARLAVVDPALTFDLPPSLTATTGLDALTQLIEPYLSSRSNPLTDSFCVEGMCRVARSLRRACEESQNAAAREDMALASLLSGLALANAGLGAVHGFAAPLGGMFPAPHGAICAALLPEVMRVNATALRQRAHNSEPLRRFDEVAKILTANRHATADEGISWVKTLCDGLSIPGLATYGVNQAAFPALIERATQASSMKANPIELTPAEMREILLAAL